MIDPNNHTAFKDTNLWQTLFSRRSTREFQSTPVPEELLITLIEAAGNAPSSSNKQPWRFLVIRTPALITQAGQIVEKACQNLMETVNPEARQDFDRYSRYFLHFRHAPVLIVPIYRHTIGFSQTINPDTFPEAYQTMLEMEQYSTIVSISLAIQNLLLAAEALKLGTCCMTGPLIAHKELAPIFKVPPDWHITMLIPLGFPAHTPENPGRKEVKSILKWL